jgi:hypothetical protein
MVKPLKLEQRRGQRHHHQQQPLVFVEIADDIVRIKARQRTDEMGQPENTTEQSRVDERLDFVQELALAEQHAGCSRITFKTGFVKRMFYSSVGSHRSWGEIHPVNAHHFTPWQAQCSS